MPVTCTITLILFYSYNAISEFLELYVSYIISAVAACISTKYLSFFIVIL